MTYCRNCDKLRRKVNDLQREVYRLNRITSDQDSRLTMYEALETFVKAVVDRSTDEAFNHFETRNDD